MKKAFTLIELMISLIVISIVVTAFLAVMTKNAPQRVKTSQGIISDCSGIDKDCRLCQGKNKCLLCDKVCTTTQYQDVEKCACKECDSADFVPGCSECDGKKCTKCKPGYFISEDGQSCTPCELGTASSDSPIGQCRDCGSGTMADTTGLGACKRCPNGTYSRVPSLPKLSPGQRATSCTPCGTGYASDYPDGSTDKTGATGCFDCRKFGNSCTSCDKTTGCLACAGEKPSTDAKASITRLKKDDGKYYCYRRVKSVGECTDLDGSKAFFNVSGLGICINTKNRGKNANGATANGVTLSVVNTGQNCKPGANKACCWLSTSSKKTAQEDTCTKSSKWMYDYGNCKKSKDQCGAGVWNLDEDSYTGCGRTVCSANASTPLCYAKLTTRLATIDELWAAEGNLLNNENPLNLCNNNLYKDYQQKFIPNCKPVANNCTGAGSGSTANKCHPNRVVVSTGGYMNIKEAIRVNNSNSVNWYNAVSVRCVQAWTQEEAEYMEFNYKY